MLHNKTCPWGKEKVIKSATKKERDEKIRESYVTTL